MLNGTTTPFILLHLSISLVRIHGHSCDYSIFWKDTPSLKLVEYAHDISLEKRCLNRLGRTWIAAFWHFSSLHSVVPYWVQSSPLQSKVYSTASPKSELLQEPFDDSLEDVQILLRVVKATTFGCMTFGTLLVAAATNCICICLCRSAFVGIQQFQL